MISKGTATRGQVQKSKGKVKTRLVRQGNRKARFRHGKATNGVDMRWNGVERQSDGLEENINALALRGVALRRH